MFPMVDKASTVPVKNHSSTGVHLQTRNVEPPGALVTLKLQQLVL